MSLLVADSSDFPFFFPPYAAHIFFRRPRRGGPHVTPQLRLPGAHNVMHNVMHYVMFMIVLPTPIPTSIAILAPSPRPRSLCCPGLTPTHTPPLPLPPPPPPPQAVSRCLGLNFNVLLRNAIQAVGGFSYLFWLAPHIASAALAVSAVLWGVTAVYGRFACVGAGRGGAGVREGGNLYRPSSLPPPPPPGAPPPARCRTRSRRPTRRLTRPLRYLASSDCSMPRRGSRHATGGACRPWPRHAT